jgi:hypothetical protein
VFVIEGLVLIGFAALGVSGPVAFWTLMVGVLGGVVGLFAYSYVVWRDDPARASLDSER